MSLRKPGPKAWTKEEEVILRDRPGKSCRRHHYLYLAKQFLTKSHLPDAECLEKNVSNIKDDAAFRLKKHTSTRSRNHHRNFNSVLLISCYILTALPTIVAAALPGKIIPQTVNSVTIVGGVHGNEYTGVWCVKSLEQRLQTTNEYQQKYESLQISTLLANPQAHLANKRFIDTDLNRQFSRQSLTKDTTKSKTVEGRRAQVIDKMLGPKIGDPMATDCIIDLHSTTANMGVTLIFPEGDVLMAQACAYALQKCTSMKTRILFESRSSREDDPFLQSVAPHGFTIEVGPVPQGVLRHDAVLSTKEALEVALDYLNRHNTQPEIVQKELEECYQDGLVPCFLYQNKIPWPSDPENPNFPAYIIHKSVQDKDFHAICKGDPLFVDLQGNVIPYDGKYGSPVNLIFINEGGYYYSSSGTGIGVATPAKFSLETGRLVEED